MDIPSSDEAGTWLLSRTLLRFRRGTSVPTEQTSYLPAVRYITTEI